MTVNIIGIIKSVTVAVAVHTRLLFVVCVCVCVCVCVFVCVSSFFTIGVPSYDVSHFNLIVSLTYILYDDCETVVVVLPWMDWIVYRQEVLLGYGCHHHHLLLLTLMMMMLEWRWYQRGTDMIHWLLFMLFPISFSLVFQIPSLNSSSSSSQIG